MIAEYIANMKELLSEKPELFRLMVERQIQVRLLPKVQGSRVELEPSLWALLVFCTEGHEAAAPAMNDDIFLQAQEAVAKGANLEGTKAVFPAAAVAVLKTLEVLREAGSFPPPKLR